MARIWRLTSAGKKRSDALLALAWMAWEALLRNGFTKCLTGCLDHPIWGSQGCHVWSLLGATHLSVSLLVLGQDSLSHTAQHIP